MIEIIPAIMPRDLEDLEMKLSQVVPFVTTVQLDLMDGNFVPPKTWPYNNRDAEALQSILREEEGMPYWDSIHFELDLMVSNVEEDLSLYLSLGAKRLVFHLASKKGINESTDAEINADQKILDMLQNIDPYIRDSIEIGLALPVDADVETLIPWLNFPGMQNGKPFIDFVQCMGIAEIGYQGKPFDETIFSQIKALRNISPGITISVDGGVNEENAEALVSAGVTRLVIGSALFESMDIEGMIRHLQKLDGR